jgi:hypothetical protein
MTTKLVACKLEHFADQRHRESKEKKKKKKKERGIRS